MAGTKTQAPLFEANAQWFHVFRDMVDRGDAAKMGSGAVMVYLVIKTYTDLSTGKSFPELSKISEKSGLSRSQVKRYFKVLEEYGYLNVERQPGKKSVYVLREKIVLKDKEASENDRVATFDYVPLAISKAQSEINNFLATGDASDARIIKIDKLVINIQHNQRDGYILNESEDKERKGITPEEIRDPEIRERAMRIDAKVRSQKGE